MPIDPPVSPLGSMTRREALESLAAAGLALPIGALLAGAAPTSRRGPILTRGIPSSGENLPLIGIGSWITFNVGDDVAARDSCAEVLRAFFGGGGRLIDSSPMYGSSQEVIGYGLGKLGHPRELFSADKVWTSGEGSGQIQESLRHWGIGRFDLLEVHNVLSWEKHLPTLLQMKRSGRIRYVGITTSEGRRHDEIEKILRSQPIDFVQVTYNVLDREVESRILPLARDRGVAVIVNRPFRRGELIRRVERAPLPHWAGEIDCAAWPQVLLKFIVSHPAVACAIPATTRPDHAAENLGASYGRLPDERLRREIVSVVERL